MVAIWVRFPSNPYSFLFLIVIQSFFYKKRVYFFTLSLLIFLSYELIGIDEDFLFLISFSVFFYSFVSTTAGYATEEFTYRKNYMYNFFNSLVDLKRKTAEFFLSYFTFLESFDIEYFSFESIFFFISNLSYRFYWDIYSETELIYSEFEDTVFRVSFDSKVESLLNGYVTENV